MQRHTFFSREGMDWVLKRSMTIGLIVLSTQTPEGGQDGVELMQMQPPRQRHVHVAGTSSRIELTLPYIYKSCPPVLLQKPETPVNPIKNVT